MEDKDVFNESKDNISKEEERNYVENNKGEPQSLQDMQEELFSETEATDSQKENSFEEGKDPRAEEDRGEGPLQSDNITEYVWNTNSNANANSNPNPILG